MFDVIVIGAGPAGLTAAQVLGRQGRSTLVLDSGRPRNAPAGEMHMFPSRDGFPPEQLRTKARHELAAYPAVQVREAEVTAARGEVGAFEVELSHGEKPQAGRLLLATGVIDELAPVPGLAERFGKGVYHCPFCHGNEVRGHTLAVLGSSGHLPGMALYLRDRFSEDVVLCTDGPAELAQPLRAALEERKVSIRGEPLRAVEGEAGALVVQFEDGESLPRQSLFHRGTERQHSPLAEQLGCELFPDGWVKVDAQQRTTVPGVFAAGDLARTGDMPVALTFVLNSASAGLTAAVWIDRELFQGTYPELFS